MGPVCHIGLTSVLLAGSKLAGVDTNQEAVFFTYVGGVFLDGDKIFEIYHRKYKKLEPDITAEDRILHSILAFPFGLFLSWLAGSFLPLFAVLLHILADSLIPGLKHQNKSYPPHAGIKWLLFPFVGKKRLEIISRNWPIEYPPKLNLLYKLMEPIGLVLTIISFLVLIG